MLVHLIYCNVWLCLTLKMIQIVFKKDLQKTLKQKKKEKNRKLSLFLSLLFFVIQA
jgi:hypothetical protein